jgi:four helix bundle suffix protein
MTDEVNNSERVLLEGANWKELRFYQKSEALYQMTFVFCERFLPKYGDRTVDQMVQAARSGKQNIIEGSEDGKTSTEMELRLLNVARSSIHELREDFKDYLLSRKLPLWDNQHPRYLAMREFTKAHNRLADYEPFFQKWNDEEMANTGYTMCCQIDVLMNGYLATLEDRFRKEGGMKERMYRVRTGYRAEQDRKMREMEATIKRQELRIKELEAELKRIREKAR